MNTVIDRLVYASLFLYISYILDIYATCARLRVPRMFVSMLVIDTDAHGPRETYIMHYTEDGNITDNRQPPDHNIMIISGSSGWPPRRARSRPEERNFENFQNSTSGAQPETPLMVIGSGGCLYE